MWVEVSTGIDLALVNHAISRSSRDSLRVDMLSSRKSMSMLMKEQKSAHNKVVPSARGFEI